MSSGVVAESAKTYGAGPLIIRTSPALSVTGPSPLVKTTEPRVRTTTVSAAPSSIRIENGGAKRALRRKAPRARGPSNNPVIASMVKTIAYGFERFNHGWSLSLPTSSGHGTNTAR